MINLTVRPARTSFSGPEKELKKMFKFLRVKDKNSHWRQRAALKRVAYFHDVEDEEERHLKIEKLKKSTEWIKFYDRRSDTFATGLLQRVTRRLEKEKIDFKVKDTRKSKPTFQKIKRFHFKDVVENRKEQIDITNVALEKGCGIIHAATNAGKTEVACAIISEYYRTTGSVPCVLFLIHRAGLVAQTMERFKKHLPSEMRVEMLGAGKKTIGSKSKIVVSTVQTASNLLSSFEFESFQERCDILFIDEFHLNKAWQCSKIVSGNKAVMRLGLSGTIDEKNKVKMLHYVGMTGPIIASVRNKELVSLGRSAKPVIRFIEVESKHIPKEFGFAKGYRLGTVKNGERNRLVVDETIRYLKKDYKTLITVARISHGLRLKGMLENEFDLRVEFLSGSSSLPSRKRTIKDFEKGKVAVLIASPIFDTGVDIPAIQAWVNAAGGRGWELTLQRLGRVLRKKEGDNRVFISDFVDQHNKYLMRHSMARIRHYIREKIADIKIIGGSHA
jgi:superfamily II DNA or RNA helicase